MTELEKLRSEYLHLQAAPNLTVWTQEEDRRAEIARLIKKLTEEEKNETLE